MSYTKVNSQMIKDLKVKSKQLNIKENVREYLNDAGIKELLFKNV